MAELRVLRKRQIPNAVPSCISAARKCREAIKPARRTSAGPSSQLKRLRKRPRSAKTLYRERVRERQKEIEDILRYSRVTNLSRYKTRLREPAQPIDLSLINPTMLAYICICVCARVRSLSVSRRTLACERSRESINDTAMSVSDRGFFPRYHHNPSRQLLR